MIIQIIEREQNERENKQNLLCVTRDDEDPVLGMQHHAAMSFHVKRQYGFQQVIIKLAIGYSIMDNVVPANILVILSSNSCRQL